MSRSKRFVDPRFAKGNMYARVMRSIVRAAVCPLCQKTMQWHTKPILKRTGGWLITENFNPYKNTEYHFIIVCNRHITRFEQIATRDWAAIASLMRWALKHFKIRGGGMTLRFGDPTWTGATIVHLHAHLIVPKLKRGKAIPVYFPIG